MIDPVVHAALVTLALFGVHWLFGLIGIRLDDQTAQALAELLVSYILSLFGLALYNRVFYKRSAIATESYKPPFT